MIIYLLINLAAILLINRGIHTKNDRLKGTGVGMILSTIIIILTNLIREIIV